MGKIKMNLDMLEEVKMQHEIAKDATEAVINKGRADLNSLTEEVWEGEDGDMARELLDDLLNNKMAQTWRELDTIHESIKKAQKSAYEAKNFCNNFPLIFNSGTMPSDTDSSPCSGELMCDKESCEQLKSSMEKAAQSASRVKSKTETLESILAELETPEAKFDYSSYTEPIKTQTQNVIDRVAIFNNAVTKYEQKVEELDQTFASELLAATPDTVPTPFDPSILFGGESVHMKDGDIVNFLEKYNIAELVEILTDTQISNILAILFDKKDVNTAELSERDYEVAFLKLPEDKKIAILMEMGLTRDQIGSIIVELAEGKAGKKGVKGKVLSGIGKILKELIEKMKKQKEQSEKDDSNGAQSGSGSNSSGNAGATPGAAIYKKGDKGDEIKLIQEWLSNNGYYTDEIDDKYGGKMELAIYRFQQQHGLPATGYIDENTKQLLDELMSSTESDPYQALVIDMNYINENYTLTEHQQDVLERLYNDTTLGLTLEKKNSMLIVGAELYALGMDDSFVIGVLANVESEGTAGEFEGRDSALNSGDPQGVDYKGVFKGSNIQVIGLQKTLELSDTIGNRGDYGMGMMQWTYYSRRIELLDAYKKAMGYPDEGDPTFEQNHPTEEQCLRIEGAFQTEEIEAFTIYNVDSIDNKAIGINKIDYHDLNLYNFWENNTSSDPKKSSEIAAYYYCLFYENPKNANSEAITRMERAAKLYDVVGGN
jgi:hypothetical protein